MAWAPKTVASFASIPQSLHSTPPASDRAISIAGFNLSKGLRRHFHRACLCGMVRARPLPEHYTFLLCS
jgi:hypothetical protein